MDWDHVLGYHKDVRRIARLLGRNVDKADYEDAVQHTLLTMHLTINLDNVRDSQRKFIIASIFNIISQYYTSRWKDFKHTSNIDVLEEWGVQVDEFGQVHVPPSVTLNNTLSLSSEEGMDE